MSPPLQLHNRDRDSYTIEEYIRILIIVITIIITVIITSIISIQDSIKLFLLLMLESLLLHFEEFAIYVVKPWLHVMTMLSQTY